MDEIEVRATRGVQVEVPIGGRPRRPIDGCVPTIARFCDCKVWLARTEAPSGDDTDTFDWTRPGSRYAFFGFGTDTWPPGQFPHGLVAARLALATRSQRRTAVEEAFAQRGLRVVR